MSAQLSPTQVSMKDTHFFQKTTYFQHATFLCRCCTFLKQNNNFKGLRHTTLCTLCLETVFCIRSMFSLCWWCSGSRFLFVPKTFGPMKAQITLTNQVMSFHVTYLNFSSVPAQPLCQEWVEIRRRIDGTLLKRKKKKKGIFIFHVLLRRTMQMNHHSLCSPWWGNMESASTPILNKAKHVRRTVTDRTPAYVPRLWFMMQSCRRTTVSAVLNS